jgi:hypothetical protein
MMLGQSGVVFGPCCGFKRFLDLPLHRLDGFGVGGRFGFGTVGGGKACLEEEGCAGLGPRLNRSM